MGLIACPDCTGDVSDKAASCIHCGAPLKPGVGQTLRTAGADILRISRTAASAALDIAKDVYAERVPGALSNIQGLKESLPGSKAPSRIKPNEVVVPVLLVPVGVGPEDYIPFFSFDRFLAEHRVRSFVRPKLEIWAGRSDVMRSKFAATIAADFSKQLRAQRHATLAPQLAKTHEQLREHASTAKTAGERARAAVAAAGGSALLMLAITNPIVDFALLTVAVFGGSRAGVDLFRKAWSESRRSMTQSEIERTHARLERELEERSIDVTRALDALQLHCHPALYSLYEDMCSVEGISTALPREPDPPDAPDCRDGLHHALRSGSVPRVYEPLFHVRLMTP